MEADTITDQIYATIPNSIRIFANIDVRKFTYIHPPQIPTELKRLTIYHPPVTDLKLTDEKKYIKFVKELVERYDGDGIDDMPNLHNPIKHWQLDNELPGISPAGALSSPFALKNKKWLETSIHNYAHILKITNRAIKEADSDAKVAMAGMPDLGPETRKLFYEYYMKILKELKDQNIDIFDYHFYGNAKTSWKTMKDAYKMIREGLERIGKGNMEIWITETGTYSGRPRELYGYAPVQTEKEQAVDLVRRLVYPLTFGAAKVFWAWGINDCALSDGPDGYMGLIYHEERTGNSGYGGKKLSYYTYKKVVEISEGSEGIYIYKFINKNTKKSVWIVWNDNLTPKKINLGIGRLQDTCKPKITELVPKYESGKEVTDYSKAFQDVNYLCPESWAIRSIVFEIKDIPVCIEVWRTF